MGPRFNDLGLQVPQLDQQRCCKQHHPVNNEYPADRDERAQQPADDRPGHGSKLRGCLIQAERAAAEARFNRLDNHCID
ncbi:hypothetical protein D3C80_1936040 [compost metagenome]